MPATLQKSAGDDGEVAAGAARRGICPVCGYSAVRTARSEEHCPNCGSELRNEPPADAGVPVGPALSVESEPRGNAGMQVGRPLHTLPRDFRIYEPVRVDILRRLPAPGGGYRDNAEVRERIRIRHRMTDGWDLAIPILMPGYLVGLATHHTLPASRIRAVERKEGRYGYRVRLVLEDGDRLTALDKLSPHQAEYVAGLIADTLGLPRTP